MADSVHIGVDVGGTFTDLVCSHADGRLDVLKVATTRHDPSVGIERALDLLADRLGDATVAITRFVHGTTAATNAVLEQRGARVGLIATRGFRDVLEIGRQKRVDMYALSLDPQTPVFLAPGARRVEVNERIAANGEVVERLDDKSIESAVEKLVAQDVQAIAVSLLFSFVNDAHERQVRAYIEARHPEVMVSLSSEVDPAYREYERTAVTAFDAYVKPVLDRYLVNLERLLERRQVECGLQVMMSRGGICSSPVARERPVGLLLSGPAAGVIGSRVVGRGVGVGDLISVDIGGTSCDIALVEDGEPVIRAEGAIGEYTLRVPMVDINTLGAGGGSIAWIDASGGLRVGPHSAGSEPGPACYAGGGVEATVTDASVVLGYLNPERFAGGGMTLDPALAQDAIDSRIARPLGLSCEEAALGIHRVLNAQMGEGIRLVSIRRGHDPRRFSMLALGGGGPVHACALATELDMEEVLVPAYPGVLSAWGLLCAPVEHAVAAAFHREIEEGLESNVRAALADLDARASILMAREAADAQEIEVLHFADVCYVGQGYHLEIPLNLVDDAPLDALYEQFLIAHDRVFGYSTRARARIVNLRSVHRAPASEAGLSPGAPEAIPSETRPVRFAPPWGEMPATIYQRQGLRPGANFEGPAIVEQADTTTVVEPGWRGCLDPGGTLRLTRTAGRIAKIGSSGGDCA